MTSSESVEHFVTLFDSHYLPQGLCLHQSLSRQAPRSHLWIVAMDDACFASLQKIRLENATVVRLQEVENEALRAVKPGRSVGEYCWTLTPFLPSYVFQRAPQIERVTYVDADLFFFRPPALLIDEFLESGKHVLITEHAFAPEYAAHAQFGRFCVQFITFRNTAPARRVLDWWQERCIEWCFAREEGGKFGDQKYLDNWPELFADEVHILRQTRSTVAPWNVAHLSRMSGAVDPVFYHFHGLKVVSATKVVLYFMYRVGRKNHWIYRRYMQAMRSAAALMRRLGIPVVGRPLLGGQVGALAFAKAVLRGHAAWASI